MTKTTEEVPETFSSPLRETHLKVAIVIKWIVNVCFGHLNADC